MAFKVVAMPVEGLQVRKKLERALHEWLQGERCPRFVLFGPGGAGKSTLAVKFAAAQVERGCGRLRLVFVLSASSMELDYMGLRGQCLSSRASAPIPCLYGTRGGKVPEVVPGSALTRTRAPRRHGAGRERRAGHVFRAIARCGA